MKGSVEKCWQLIEGRASYICFLLWWRWTVSPPRKHQKSGTKDGLLCLSAARKHLWSLLKSPFFSVCKRKRVKLFSWFHETETIQLKVFTSSSSFKLQSKSVWQIFLKRRHSHSHSHSYSYLLSGGFFFPAFVGTLLQQIVGVCNMKNDADPLRKTRENLDCGRFLWMYFKRSFNLFHLRFKVIVEPSADKKRTGLLLVKPGGPPTLVTN